jgi:hypothetical protein
MGSVGLGIGPTAVVVVVVVVDEASETAVLPATPADAVSPVEGAAAVAITPDAAAEADPDVATGPDVPPTAPTAPTAPSPAATPVDSVEALDCEDALPSAACTCDVFRIAAICPSGRDESSGDGAASEAGSESAFSLGIFEEPFCETGLDAWAVAGLPAVAAAPVAPAVAFASVGSVWREFAAGVAGRQIGAIDEGAAVASARPVANLVELSGADWTCRRAPDLASAASARVA